MIGLLDIKKAITNLIRSKYPQAKIYFDNIDKCEMPYFYVEFTAIKNITLDSVYTDKLIQIDILYCPASKQDCNRNMLFAISDELDKIFRPVFPIMDRYITLQEVEIKIHDDILHYIFNLDFADAFDEEETHELMRTLKMDWR